MAKKQKSYTAEFKQQIVDLYNTASKLKTRTHVQNVLDFILYIKYHIIYIDCYILKKQGGIGYWDITQQRRCSCPIGFIKRSTSRRKFLWQN